MLDRTELIPVADGERRRIGPVDCQFIPVTHSVPHGFAIAFFTPAGTIIHSGDFKLDLTPVDGRRTNLALLGEIASRDGGVRLLMSDSTNAERPGLHAVGVDGRRGDAIAVPRVPRQAVHRHELRVAPAPRAAGRAGRDRQRPQDRVRRPVDAAEHHDGARARLHRHSRLRGHRHRRGAQARARRGVHHLHRFAGRADERAVADGRARAQAREDLARRRRGDQRARDPRQRVERVARDRLAAPRRRRGRARPHVAGARVGARVAGRAEVPAQPARARVVRARARRVPPPRAPRAARARRRRRRRPGAHLRRRRRRSRSRPKARTANAAPCRPGYMYVDGIVGDIGHGVLRDRRGARRGRRRRRDRDRRHAGRRDRDRPRDRDARLGVRARGRGSHRRRQAGGARRRSTARSPKARSTSTRCAATPAARSASSSTSARGAGRS